MQHYSGFTLIELMIVIAIVGILATFSIPAYQDYVARSQASEAYSLSSAIKGIVADIYLDEGAYTNINNGYLSIPTDVSLGGNYTAGISVTTGVIVAELGNEASGLINGQTIGLSPVDRGGSITWVCRFSGESRFAPKACR